MEVGDSEINTCALFFRDGAPYCERDYQIHFGVQCEACHQYITGRVLEVRTLYSVKEKYYLCCSVSFDLFLDYPSFYNHIVL